MISSKLLVNSLFLKKGSYFGRRNKPYQCKKYFKVNHLMFDLDGTVLNNQEILDAAYREVFKKYGLAYTYEWRFKIFGMTGKAMWKKVVKELKVKADWQRLYHEYQHIVHESLPNAPLKPGIERLVNHFEKHGIPMAVVTSSTKATMERKTSHIPELMAKFAHVLCAGDDPLVTKSKPNGQIYTLCAGRFPGKPDPDTCLVFENTPNGIMAASCACMQVIGVPSPPITCQQDIAFANETICTLNDFWPGKRSLPPFPEQINAPPPPPRF